MPGCGLGYRILIGGLTEKNNSFNFFSHFFVLVVRGIGRYRGPAGQLDTLHVFSEGSGDRNFYKKVIEGPSSYSYI